MADAPAFALGVLTRGRRDAATACIDSALRHADDLVVFCVVDDDRAAAAYLSNYYEGNPRVHVGLLPLRHYYVRGVNALGRWMQEAGVDHFAITNDDATFAVDGWDTTCRALAAEGEIVELAGDDLCAHYTSRMRTFVDHFHGLLAEPSYTFYCSDTELRERAKELRLYSARPDLALVTHHAADDAVHSEITFWFAIDRATYERRWRSPWKKEEWQRGIYGSSSRDTYVA